MGKALSEQAEGVTNGFQLARICLLEHQRSLGSFLQKHPKWLILKATWDPYNTLNFKATPAHPELREVIRPGPNWVYTNNVSEELLQAILDAEVRGFSLFLRLFLPILVGMPDVLVKRLLNFSSALQRQSTAPPTPETPDPERQGQISLGAFDVGQCLDFKPHPQPLDNSYFI